MISLRYHAVSLAAAFLALALGVVLGSSALSGTLLSGLSGQRDQLGRQVSDLQTQRDALTSQLAQDDQFDTGIGPLAVRGLLAGHSVLLVATADASQADRNALAALLGAAGATVTGELTLTPAFTDAGRADQLRDLVTRLIPAGAQLPVASDPGTLAGGLFADLWLLNKATDAEQSTADERSAALSGLLAGGFVTAGGSVAPAQSVIVLTGGAQAGAAGPDQAAMLARFAAQLQRGGAAAVLAGAAGSASGNGAVGVVRADVPTDSVLSTVDDADTAAGRIVTVLALRQSFAGRAGAYGTAGSAQAPVPDETSS